MTGDDTGLTKLRNFCVGIGYIGRKIGGTIITIKCLADNVSPCAGEKVICSGKFKCNAGFDGCQTAAVENIELIFVTFAVLNEVKSRLVRPEQL